MNTTTREQFWEVMRQFIDAMESNRMCPERPPRPGVPALVYFLRCGPYVKIGYSVHPRTRLNQLRNGDDTKCPEGIDRKSIALVTTEPGGRNREYELHQQFKHLHHWGEWFMEAPELTEYIESVSERKPSECQSSQPSQRRIRPAASSGRAGSRFTSPPAQLFKELPRLR